MGRQVGEHAPFLQCKPKGARLASEPDGEPETARSVDQFVICGSKARPCQSHRECRISRGEECLVLAMAQDSEWKSVATRSSVGAGDMMAVTVGDKQIALYDVDGEIFATDNICSHAFAVLTDGWLDGNEIECPLHAGRFDVKT